MNTAELVASVVSAAQLSHKDAKAAVDAVFRSIHEALVTGDSVRIALGTFSVKDRAARTARNPQTGGTVKVAASKVAKFKPSKALKNGLNAKPAKKKTAAKAAPATKVAAAKTAPATKAAPAKQAAAKPAKASATRKSATATKTSKRSA
jgi:DNA-binding protein HU-beta